jgi:hypothetical protein
MNEVELKTAAEWESALSNIPDIKAMIKTCRAFLREFEFDVPLLAALSQGPPINSATEYKDVLATLADAIRDSRDPAVQTMREAGITRGLSPQDFDRMTAMSLLSTTQLIAAGRLVNRARAARKPKG